MRTLARLQRGLIRTVVDWIACARRHQADIRLFGGRTRQLFVSSAALQAACPPDGEVG
jgi:hypothetical protein